MVIQVESDRVQRMFGQQRQGVIIKASEEQVRAMSQHEEGGIWPFRGGESKGTINMYDQRPTHSNQYGHLFEVDSSQFRHLQDLDVAVSLANITQASTRSLYTQIINLLLAPTNLLHIQLINFL